MDARLKLDVERPLVKNNIKKRIQILQDVPWIKPYIVLKMLGANFK